MSSPEWTPAQVRAAKRVVAAALALDRRTHSWSDWYRKTYHHAPTIDEPTWDELDAALTAFIEATDLLAIAEAYYPRAGKAQ